MFGAIKSVHFVGICGTAMASVAAAIKDRGYVVTGSDQNIYPPMSTFLAEKNIPVIAGYAANVTLYQGKLPFDPRKDLVPVSLAGIAPLIMTATPGLPAKDVKELIAYAKANPGKLNFGSSGIGAAAHLTTELFKQTVGVDMVHVPFKGTAPALQALMANDIQILVDVPSTLMPHVRGNKIKALAMFSKERIQGAAEVPTMAEAGTDVNIT